ELNAEKSGILKIKAKEGDVVKIGGVVCEIEANGAAKTESKESKKEESKKESSGKATVVEMKIPPVGESITEVTIARWQKKTGDVVSFEEVLCEIESDKATFELNAEAGGTLEILVKEGTTISIGTPICKITTTGDVPVKKTASVTDNSSKTSDKNYAEGHTSPAANKILAEKGIKTEEVKGTGKDGRITKEDAMNANKKSETVSQKAENTAPVSLGGRNQRRQKMTSLRKTVSRRLVAVKNETAMLTTFNEVDMKPIMDLRAKYKDQFKEKFQVGLGFMSFFTKACCLALQEYPAVNAMIDGDEIVYNDFCDVSIAVSAPKGLVVPVIRNAEAMSFDQIEKEIVRLATRARDNKLTIEEMSGGTFTITNGGIFGSMLSTPIINAPQSAILGMHNIVERPMAVNGQVVIKPIMYVALSYDHRIIDGRESVGFLVRVKQLLEDPSRLLLGI
ncbi:MAG: 2-oxoglutarate dehydrogenase complex dihydrolipoyllysine-residue succinyltransferase, partial [Cytophagaceae bacterium]|nr:2-oxoglutarate dehydrogenase complex dihydrolipoyllysine-residue succinyltransferase [Cytophagaceae bacterium]